MRNYETNPFSGLRNEPKSTVAVATHGRSVGCAQGAPPLPGVGDGRARRFSTVRRLTTSVLGVMVLLAGCSPSAGTATGSASPNDSTEGGYGNFSFDLGGQSAGTNGAQEPGPYAEVGAALYRSPEQACVICHGTNAEGAARGGTIVGTSAEQLREVLGGETDHEGVPRPALTDNDYRNLEAFLATVGQDIGTNGTDTDTNG